jgi:5-carboxymethyl-2-hydroxymuconate isomerase
MPHLQFEVSTGLPAEAKGEFTDWVTDRYATEMDTGTGHVAVTIRERERGALALGRADEDEPVAVLDADIRAGRSATQRRAFASRVIEELEARFSIPAENVYAVYTEHSGEDFHLAEGRLRSWEAGEDPDAGSDRDPTDSPTE